MSHTLTLTDVKLSIEAAIKAAQKLELRYKENDKVRFYDGKTAEGLSIKLPGWSHPLVITDSGTCVYDNYHGSWGNIEELVKLTGMTMIAMANHSLDEVSIIKTPGGFEFESEYLEIAVL